MTVFIETSGLKNFLRLLDQFPDITRQSASIALNQTAQRKGLVLAKEKMLEQVAFPSGYLTDPRFLVSRKATPSNLVSVITGRDTPTSLARFTGTQSARFTTGIRSHNRRVKRPAIKVQIKPGKFVTLPNAFFLTLRNGNTAVAIRLKPGEVLHSTVGAKMITTGRLAGVALLYGPSVDQVFRTVAAQIMPELELELESEFLRQFELRIR